MRLGDALSTVTQGPRYTAIVFPIEISLDLG
jgi:hypothetical protein